MVHSVPSPDAAEQVVNDFWAGIRTGDLNTIVETTREELRALCPSVDTFSFDIVDDPQAEAAERESPLAAAETGTPRPVVTSWNEDKLVGLFQYSADLCCGAAVGNDVTPAAHDFKACCLPLSLANTGVLQEPMLVQKPNACSDRWGTLLWPLQCRPLQAPPSRYSPGRCWMGRISGTFVIRQIGAN
jgi:hypothetical protein